jgi:hypothetical protein
MLAGGWRVDGTISFDWKWFRTPWQPSPWQPPIWDAATGAELARASGKMEIGFATWSPDRALVVTGVQSPSNSPEADSDLKLWEVTVTTKRK